MNSTPRPLTPILLLSAAFLLASCENIVFKHIFSSPQQDHFLGEQESEKSASITVGGEEFTLRNAHTLVDTDFSTDRGFILSHDRPTVVVEEGALHLYGTEPGCETAARFGKNTFISYRMKVENQGGNVEVSFFWDNNDGNDYRQLIAIPPSSPIQWDTIANGTTVDSGSSTPQTTVSLGEWHQIEVLLHDGDFSFYYNDSKIIDITLHEELNRDGPMFLLSSDSDYYIDDLEIVTFETLE